MAMNKKGVFFSTDALIALIIILMSIVVAYPIIKYSTYETSIQSDVMNVLSVLKIGEIDNVYVQGLISNGNISNLNNTVLEQIGEFYVTDEEQAKLLCDSVLSELDIKESIGIWYGDKLICSVNSTAIDNPKNIEVDRQIISGIREGESVTGFSARAYLSRDIQTKYFYFGGYVGDGNISLNIDYSGIINSSEIELTINNDFEIYVNGDKQGDYSKSASEFIPVRYSIPAVDFNSGNNLIEIRGKNLHIGGGYIKINYKPNVQYTQTKKYSFPGIDGIVNLYDGFDFPSQINEMNLFLHIDNNNTFFLIIGNQTVYDGATSGEEEITINDASLSSLLDYDSLEGKTVPIRLGLENASYTSQLGGIGDVYSVTDLSGSMADGCINYNWFCCLLSGSCNTQTKCNSCSGYWQEKITLAKQANKVFIDSVLNISGNRVGLIGYATSSISSYSHVLSNDSVSLKAKVDQWVANGNTCVCCGINSAVSGLLNYSTSDKFRSMVVMSDGEANVQCAQQGTGNAKQDAIKAACDAYNNYGIRVYSVGFADADETTLQAIATCGNGSYYYSSISEIAEIYQEIAEDIIEASYNEQTIEILGQLYSKLYPNSYIEIDYTEEQIPYGLIISSEKQFDNEYQGSFDIPFNSSVLDVKVVSYSGPRWTKEVNINNINVYDLSSYGSDYIKLGDPYVINIPTYLINTTNNIEVTTGLSPLNSSAGSVYNKIIYSILKNVTAYSQISASAEGCIWNLEFEDNSTSAVRIPISYVGSNECYYTSSNIAYNENDAIQNAVYSLLTKLDFDSNGKIDSQIFTQDLKIESSEITGIPYTWSTEVQVRRWD
ncbi:MAG: vWA domain-containing protein [Candidatus Pacearchaeota archaeon]